MGLGATREQWNESQPWRKVGGRFGVFNNVVGLHSQGPQGPPGTPGTLGTPWDPGSSQKPPGTPGSPLEPLGTPGSPCPIVVNVIEIVVLKNAKSRSRVFGGSEISIEIFERAILPWTISSPKIRNLEGGFSKSRRRFSEISKAVFQKLGALQGLTL